MYRKLILAAAFALMLTACTPADIPAPETAGGSDTAGTESQSGETTHVPEPVSAELTPLGRTWNEGGRLWIYWSNSGFRASFTGTAVSADLMAHDDYGYSVYLTVYIDGSDTPSNTVRVPGSGSCELISGLEPGEHIIEVRKRNEPVYSSIGIVGVGALEITGGELGAAPAAPERVIEFIGDSITCGYGNTVTDGRGFFTTDTEDGTMSFAPLTARVFGTDARVVARSGIGFLTGASCDTLYDCYKQTAGLPDSPLCTDAWDFSENKSDLIVINLGTNDDYSLVDNVRVTDEYMTAEALKFLKLVRSCNPDTPIIWAYGMMGAGRSAAISAAVEAFRAEGDDNVHYLELSHSNIASEGIGINTHPTIQSSLMRSVTLAETITGLTGWKADYGVLLRSQLHLLKSYMEDGGLDSYTAVSAAKFIDAYNAASALVADGSDEQRVTELRKLGAAAVALVRVSG